jgi:predicted RNA-binding protein (virulence factor B family)
VNYVNQIGALWIGVWKRHFVPFKEQARPMEKGKRYLVYFIWMKTNRLVASSKTNHFLK